ncbi:MAG: ribosome maturation factor RimM [Gammaproteobacteria bacterium]|nr:ribosome maturation factor RimM [Gammaproteobacteria bacterium]
MAEEIVVVGKITSAFGVKGGVKVFSYTKPRLNIVNYDPWFLKVEGDWREFKGVKGRQQGKSIAVELHGVEDRNAAEKLSGTLIGITSEQLPELNDDEFYWRDLEGMSVINLQDVPFGKVSHLIETGSNDVLVVHETAAEREEGKKRKERMIPFTKQAVIDIDKESRIITVDWDADF